MNNLYMVFILITSTVLFACTGTKLDKNINKYLIGEEFVIEDMYEQKLNVSFLKKDFQLEKRPEDSPDEPSDFISIPYEMDVRAYITLNGKVKKEVTSLNSFEGYCAIDSADKAIEFVRLLTSRYTFFLFRPNVFIEVFNKEEIELPIDNYYGGCSSEFFKKYNLKKLEIMDKKEYFEIHRNLLSFPTYGLENKHATLYSVTEKVYKTGRYEINRTKVVDDLQNTDISYPLVPL